MAEREKKARYQGYNLEGKAVVKEKGWFWKVLALSLVLSILICSVFILAFFKRTQKITAYIEKINKANTMQNLLAEHENVQIIQTYAHLAEDEDYRTTRQVENTEKGYYNYYKIEGGEKDEFKEVIKNKRYYSYDGRFATFTGLLENEYDEIYAPKIEGEVFQMNTKDKISEQRESGDIIKLDIEYTVQSGDLYNTRYGFEADTVVKKTVTLDKKTNFIISETETVNDEEFYSYMVQFDMKRKVPNFYKQLQKNKRDKGTRTITVNYDYNGDNPQTYSYTIPQDCYFDMLDHEGMKLYQDIYGYSEFGDMQVQLQNPNTDLVLYAIKDAE